MKGICRPDLPEHFGQWYSKSFSIRGQIKKERPFELNLHYFISFYISSSLLLLRHLLSWIRLVVSEAMIPFM